ncbi:MAG: C39 family peptidase [Planctomycetota bacterium]
MARGLHSHGCVKQAAFPVGLLAWGLQAALAAGCGGGEGGGGSPATSVAGATEVRPAPHVALRAERPAPVRSGPRETYGLIGTLPAGQVYIASHKIGPWWKICYDGGYGYVSETDAPAFALGDALQILSPAVEVRDAAQAPLGQAYLAQVYAPAPELSTPTHAAIYWSGRIGYVPLADTRPVALADPAELPGTESLSLPLLHFAQTTPYFCGPATLQMLAAYLAARAVSQDELAAALGTDPRNGTSFAALVEATPTYAQTPYAAVPYDADAVRRNLRGNYPVIAAVDTSYLAYWNYAPSFHFSPIKGFTRAGGFLIHDSIQGPDRWVSEVELFNAEQAYSNQIGVRL